MADPMNRDAWLRPLYRRVAVVCVCLAWVAFELWKAPGEMWLWVAMAMTGWAVYDFFLTGRYSTPVAK